MVWIRIKNNTERGVKVSYEIDSMGAGDNIFEVVANGSVMKIKYIEVTKIDD